MLDPVNQIHLNGQLIKYNAIQKNVFSKKIQDDIDTGLCFGYSFLQSYFVSLGLWSEKKWDTQTQKIAKTNLASDLSKDLRAIFETFFGCLLWYYADSSKAVYSEGVKKYIEILEKDSGLNFNQHNILKPGNPFFYSDLGSDRAKKKHINYRVMVGGHFSMNDLKRLLSDASFFAQKGIYLIENLGHTCAFRFSTSTKKWRFFNPNNPSGEEEFPSLEKFAEKVFNELSHNLSIIIATWDDGFDQTKGDALLEKYHAILKNNSETVLVPDGIKVIFNRATSILLILFKQGKQDDKFLIALNTDHIFKTMITDQRMIDIFSQLLHENDNELLEYIYSNFSKTTAQIATLRNLIKFQLVHEKSNPDSLTEIFKLANTKNSKQKLILQSLKKALTEDFIPKIYENQPENRKLLTQVMYFQLQNKYFPYSFIALLHTKNTQKVKGFINVLSHIDRDIEGFNELKKLMECIYKSYLGKTKILKKLMSFQLEHPELHYSLLQVFELSKQDPIVLQRLSNVLTYNNQEMITHIYKHHSDNVALLKQLIYFQLLILKNDTALKEMIKPSKTDKKTLDNLSAILSDNNSELLKELIKQDHKFYLKEIIALAKKDKKILQALATALHGNNDELLKSVLNIGYANLLQPLIKRQITCSYAGNNEVIFIKFGDEELSFNELQKKIASNYQVAQDDFAISYLFTPDNQKITIVPITDDNSAHSIQMIALDILPIHIQRKSVDILLMHNNTGQQVFRVKKTKSFKDFKEEIVKVFNIDASIIDIIIDENQYNAILIQPDARINNMNYTYMLPFELKQRDKSQQKVTQTQKETTPVIKAMAKQGTFSMKNNSIEQTNCTQAHKRSNF